MGRAHILLSLAVVLSLAGARPREGHVTLVPWKVAEPGSAIDAALVLFWMPASREELRRSDLLISRELTLYSSQCVAMRVVRADDTRRIAHLDPGPVLPAVVLTDGRGVIIGKLNSESGRLSARAVEELVRNELERRAAEADGVLDQAREKIAEGDVAGATILYRTVHDQRCVTPRQGREAERALRRLRRR